MVVSAAFGELTEVLKCLERTDAEVKNVEIGEQLVDKQDEITADLTVGVPVLAGVELHDGVSVQAENFDLQDECVDIDLSVSLSVDESLEGYDSSPTGVGTSPELTGSNTVPAYKDPDALQTVYEEHDTFPEMTEALGADVTSETVRRYMVEYDIHDPNDTKPQVHRHAAEQTEAGRTSAGPTANDESDGVATADSAETAPDQSAEVTGDDQLEDATAEETSVTRESEKAVSTTNESPATAETDDPDRTDGDDDAVETNSEDADTSELDETSVAELIAETDSGDGDDSLVADGLGIPKGLTVSELATIVNESNTLYEVKKRLGVDQDHARRLLKETALMDLVTQRLGADQIRVSPREVRRRINRGASDPSQ